MVKVSLNVLFIYPTSWHDSYICMPIYESGSRSDPTNYRGIAINNILHVGNVFSINLNNRLEKFITSNSLIDDTQIGFKRIVERPITC